VTPDQAAAAYVDTFAKASSVRAVDTQGDLGTKFAPVCSRCGSTDWYLDLHSSGRTMASMARCSGCHSRWETEEVAVARPRVKRRVSEPAVLIRAVDLGLVFHRATQRERWGVQTFLLYAGERVRNDKIVARVARERWPGAPFRWTEESAKRMIERGRRAVLRELEDLEARSAAASSC
jgi:hypothetical protein